MRWMMDFCANINSPLPPRFFRPGLADGNCLTNDLNTYPFLMHRWYVCIVCNLTLYSVPTVLTLDSKEQC